MDAKIEKSLLAYVDELRIARQKEIIREILGNARFRESELETSRAEEKSRDFLSSRLRG